MHIAQADTVTLTAWSGIMISKTRCLILRKSIGVATRFMIEPMTTIMFVICRIFFLLSRSFWIKRFFSSSSFAFLICSIASNADK